MDDKAIIEDVAKQMGVKPEDVRYMLEFYKDFIRDHFKDFDPRKPLIDQYTAFKIPAIGTVSVVKSYLVMDAFELGLVPETEEFDAVRKVYSPEQLQKIRKRLERNVSYVDDIQRDGYQATMERAMKEEREKIKREKDATST